MAIFKSGNPTISEKIFQKSITGDQQQVMTVRGTLNKFGFLFIMVMASGFLHGMHFPKEQMFHLICGVE